MSISIVTTKLTSYKFKVFLIFIFSPVHCDAQCRRSKDNVKYVARKCFFLISQNALVLSKISSLFFNFFHVVFTVSQFVFDCSPVEIMLQMNKRAKIAPSYDRLFVDFLSHLTTKTALLLL